VSGGALKLAIFDVDGTLIDSQAHILAAMQGGFQAAGLPVPDRDTTLSIVGLSLPVAIARLVPGADAPTLAAIVNGYRTSFATLRARDGAALSPLYPGMRAVLDTLAARDDLVLGVATGKSRRGMAHLCQLHGFGPLFQTVQVADDHPSKPHPSMIEACLRETGVEAEHAVILGDTSFDMEMGRAAGVRRIGVNWGYHDRTALIAAGAEAVAEQAGDLPGLIDGIWRRA